MDTRFAAAIAAVAEAEPQSNGEVQTIPGRLLLADGDGLCYYCAGNDDTAPGTARANLLDKVRSAARSAGAERVKILVTGRGSHKGHRYAVARVKPYQGQRDGGRRPKNWAFLRETLETWAPTDDIEVEITTDAEADDLFSRYATSHPDCVIYTQDKDMQMVYGWHLEWTTHLLVHVPKGTWEKVHSEDTYGRKWFWMQMLHGDGADNIPGLPWYTDGSVYAKTYKDKEKRGTIKTLQCGAASSAVKGLADVSSDMGACLYLQGLYRTCYGDRWLVEMLEQGILLWMRTDQTSSALDVVAPGNPLHAITTHQLWPAARQEVLLRIAESQVVHAETEDDGSGDGARGDAVGAEREVRPVPTHVQAPGAGSLAFNGTCASDLVQRVQQPAGQGGEQSPPVRSAEPAGVPAWLRAVSAKAHH